MKHTRRIFLAAFGLSFGAITASATSFNGNTFSGDLSDPAFWGGAIPTDSIVFQVNGKGTYTVTRDVTFAGMFLDWGEVEIDASANNPTITMTASISVNNSKKMTFKGGIYNFGGNVKVFNTSNWNENRFGEVTITLNGCVFTNSPGVLWLQNNSKPGSTYTLKNGAELHVDGRFGLTPGSVTAAGLSLSVLSGSRVRCGKFLTDEQGGYVNHPTVVSGPGSSFVTTGMSSANWSAIGNKRSGESLLVDDGASVDFSATDFYLGLGEGGTSSVSNSVTITGGATAKFNRVFLGGWAATDGNVLRILDGANVSTGGIRLTGDGAGVRHSELVVSNATLTAVKLMAPNENAKGYDATIRIQGENPKIAITSSDSNAGEFIRNTTLVFDVPPEGWTNTTAIMSAPAGGIYGDASATIRINGMEECVRKMKAKAVIPLMASSTGAQFPAAVRNSTNAAMPGEALDRCQVLYKNQLSASEQSLFPSAHSLDLFLRIKPILSTMVVIR